MVAELIREGCMKMVFAVIKPFRLDDVIEGLKLVGVNGITVMEAKGFGRQRGHTKLLEGEESEVPFLPKVLVMVLAGDERADRVKRAILESSGTGREGDGVLWQINFEEYIRIRTGEVVRE